MSENIHQHWLPAGYLARFSLEPAKRRDAPLFVVGAKTSFKSTAGKLARGRGFYTRRLDGTAASPADRQREAEINGELERGLLARLRRVRPGRLSGPDGANLMFGAVLLHLRGPRVENRSTEMRLDAVQELGVHYLAGLVLADQPGYQKAQMPFDEVARRMQEEWEHAVVEADPPWVNLFTSDAPAVLLDGLSRRVALVLLPVSPTQVYVAARKTDFGLASSRFTSADACWLNAVQAAQCVRQIYRGRPFMESDVPDIQAGITRARDRSVARDIYEDGRVGRGEFRVEGGIPLSFLSPR